MQIINEQFFKFILPDKRTILQYKNKDGNNIIFRNILIYGGQGSGKTSTVNSICYYAIKKYKDQINCTVSEDGDLESLMKYGLEDKLVNILFADNLTLRPVKKETLVEYFNIRHHFLNRFGKNNGYILSLLGVHRIHSIPVELRTTLDGIIVKDSSVNPYDRAVLKHYIGDTPLQLFDEIALKRDKNPDLRKYSYFFGKGLNGMLVLEFRRKNYLNSLFNISKLLQNIMSEVK